MASIYKLEGRAFEIDRELNEIEYQIEENGGEVTPEIEERMAALEAERTEIIKDIASKPEKYFRWYKNTKADLDTYKKAKEEIEKKRKSAENRLGFIQTLLTEAMVVNEKEEIREEGGLFYAKLSKTNQTKFDEETVLTPYKAIIDKLTAKLPDYIKANIEIKVGGFKKDQKLPEGFWREQNIKAQVK